MTEPQRRSSSLPLASVIFLAYLALSWASWLLLQLRADASIFWMLWLPAGLTFAAIWRFGRPALLATLLGAALSGLFITGSLIVGLLASASAVLSAQLACWLLRRLAVIDPLADPRSMFRFVLVACLLAPMLNAFVGAGAHLVAGRIDQFAPIWLSWWAAEAAGVLLLAPALLSLPQLWRLRLPPPRWLELALLIGAVLLFWSQLFLLRSWPDAPPLAFTAVLPLIWAALRFRFAVVIWVLLLQVLLVVASTQAGRGLFARVDPVESTLYLHAFVAAIAGVGLALGAAIAAQRRSIDALRRSEVLLGELTESGTALVWMSDADGRIIYRNQAWAAVTGNCGADSLPAWVERVHPGDRMAVQQHFRQARHSRERHEYEYRFIGDDGRLRWLFDTGRARFDDEGSFIGFIGSTIDISARKRSEALLSAQAGVLRSLSLDMPLERLLHDLASFVDSQLLGGRCTVLLADVERGVLRHYAGPQLPEDYIRLLDGLPIGEGHGSCGTAAARRMAVSVADVRSDPLWREVLPLVERYDWLRACWSMPFSGNRNELLGVISIYCEQPRLPRDEEQELLRTLSALAAIVVQRSREAERLRESEAGLRVTFQQAAVGVAEIALQGGLRRVNQRFCDIVGYTEAEILTPGFVALSHPEDQPTVLAARRELLAGRDSVSFEQRYVRCGGEAVWVRVWWSLVRDSNDMPDYFIAVVEDVSEHRRAAAEIERLALYDTLTDLPNRRLFLDRLQRALSVARRNGRHGALLFIDLDHFKHLNDARGHHAGDMLLRQVAQRLRAGSRDEDTVARLGGDEFVILLENIGDSVDSATASAGAVAEKVRQALIAPFSLEGGAYEHHVFASIGVTLFPKAGSSADELVKEADTAMYRAKASGRNRICFYAPEMQQAAELRLSLERDLRAAIGSDQLFLVLQPQLHVDGEVACAEALLRWNHPQRGAISPAVFIPVAEESGLIVPLGEWVLNEVAKLTRAFDGADNEVEIAVNVSPRQFHEADFVERVRTILADHGADPRRLLLEITEGVVMRDVDDAIAKMSEFERMGIRLAIDDFGVGYSSLSYLKQLPLHELKIDRTFVAELPRDSNDVAIVETILAMARHLQLEVVAEGVETEAQFDFLKAHGCRFFQGYYFSVPLPPEQLLPRMRTARRWLPAA